MSSAAVRQFSIVAAQAKRFSTRTDVTFNWPRLSLPGLARKMSAS